MAPAALSVARFPATDPPVIELSWQVGMGRWETYPSFAGLPAALPENRVKHP